MEKNFIFTLKHNVGWVFPHPEKRPLSPHFSKPALKHCGLQLVKRFPSGSTGYEPHSTARTHAASKGTFVTDVQIAGQIRAMAAGEAAAAASCATKRRTPPAQDHDAAQHTSGPDAASAKLPGGKDRIAPRPLNAGRPKAYEN